MHIPDDFNSLPAVDKAALLYPNSSEMFYENLPEVLVASFEQDEASSKSSLVVYAHIQPLFLSGMADTEIIADGDASLIENSDVNLSKLRYGGDVAKMLVWIVAIAAIRKLQLPLPFKVEIIIDCLEEAHTTLLEKALQRLVKSRHLSSKNAGVVIMDGSFLQSYKPAIIHGYRGLSTFFAKAQAQFADLHSGYFGGVLMEPLAALVHALSSLVHPNGSIAGALGRGGCREEGRGGEGKERGEEGGGDEEESDDPAKFLSCKTGNWIRSTRR
mmetsp:Transcript_2354/g.7138  ORF Transcript_2354/g.7138 Transcript_2354/m.7138 type:complete len:272 (-) Transcript_2354:2599-3414(-)